MEDIVQNGSVGELVEYLYDELLYFNFDYSYGDDSIDEDWIYEYGADVCRADAEGIAPAMFETVKQALQNNERISLSVSEIYDVLDEMSYHGCDNGYSSLITTGYNKKTNSVTRIIDRINSASDRQKIYDAIGKNCLSKNFYEKIDWTMRAFDGINESVLSPEINEKAKLIAMNLILNTDFIEEHTGDGYPSDGIQSAIKKSLGDDVFDAPRILSDYFGNNEYGFDRLIEAVNDMYAEKPETEHPKNAQDIIKMLEPIGRDMLSYVMDNGKYQEFRSDNNSITFNPERDFQATFSTSWNPVVTRGLNVTLSMIPDEQTRNMLEELSEHFRESNGQPLGFQTLMQTLGTYALEQKMDFDHGFDELRQSYDEFKNDCAHGNAGYVIEFFGGDDKFMNICINEYKTAKETGDYNRCEQVKSLVNDFLNDKMTVLEYNDKEDFEKYDIEAGWTREESGIYFENLVNMAKDDCFISRYEIEQTMYKIQESGLSNEDKTKITENILGESNSSGFMGRRVNIGVDTFRAINDSKFFSDEQKESLKQDTLNLIGREFPEYDRYDWDKNAVLLDENLVYIIENAEYIHSDNAVKADNAVKDIEDCMKRPDRHIKDTIYYINYNIDRETDEREYKIENTQLFSEHNIDVKEFGFYYLREFERLINQGIAQDTLDEITAGVKDGDIESPDVVYRMGALAITEQNMTDEQTNMQEEPEAEHTMTFTGDDISDDYDER